MVNVMCTYDIKITFADKGNKFKCLLVLFIY